MIFYDIAENIKHSKLLKYADDAVIYIASKDFSTINKLLAEDLELLAEWFDSNGLLINLKKGKLEYLLFGTNQKISKQKVQYKGDDVIISETYNYLGVDLTSNFRSISNK